MWNPFKKGPSREDRMLEMMEKMLEHTQQLTTRNLAAVEAMSTTAQKYAEVLGEYIQLFKQPGEPERWVDDPVAKNMAELKAAGFPTEKTEAEQAEWILENL